MTTAPSPRQLKNSGLLHLLESQGRNGDNMLVHVNPAEALILKMLGGSGTKNPHTGLFEFYGSEGGAGSMGKSTGGQGSAGADKSVGGDRGGGPARSGVGNENSAAGGLSAEKRDTSYGGGYSGGSGSGGGGQGSAPAITTKWGNENAYNGDVNDTADPGVDLGVGLGEGIGTAAGAVVAGELGAAVLGGFGSLIDKLAGWGHVTIGGQSVTDKRDSFKDGSGSGGASNIGRGNSRGDSGNLGGLGQTAQQNNAGGGLVATPVTPPVAPPTIGPPPTSSDQLTQGLLAYLAQNPGMLQGYTGTSRFGTGTVSPFSYYRPIA
jgi:hypothetical protein